jgi:hypothetical protein
MCAAELQEIYYAQEFVEKFGVTDWSLAGFETSTWLLRFFFQTH